MRSNQERAAVGRYVRKITLLGLLAALALVFSFLEGLLPPLPGLPPGFRLGLSNVVTMYCLFYLGKKPAFFVAAVKSGFVFLTRGAAAFFMSFCGGMLSLAAMILLLYIKRARISYLLLSVFGAVFHNVGQLFAAFVYLNNKYVLYYFPVLLGVGIGMGAVTAGLLKATAPAIERIGIAAESVDKDRL